MPKNNEPRVTSFGMKQHCHPQLMKQSQIQPGFYMNHTVHKNIRYHEKPGGAPDQYGNVYDDEVKVVEKPALSNTMRDRLINESRGLGADPNQKHPRGSNGQWPPCHDARAI